MKKKLLALYSLKFNPFCADIPTSALFPTPATESFCWRIENQVGEGGFALVSGEPGSGKSAALRLLSDRLSAMQNVMVGVLSRPQASILLVILAGDSRLTDRLHHTDLLPIASRIRTRLRLEPATTHQLRDCLAHLLTRAGNPSLMNASVQNALCEHAAGNYRLLVNMANELLALAVSREVPQIDEKLFFEAFDMQTALNAAKKRKS
jgi:type II secretory pathway predicted ATPase ExeA